MKRVEEVKRPLKKGEKYFVPCLVTEQPKDEQEMWLDYENTAYSETLKIIPVFNNPHNDIESGQKEYHYHTDLRFIPQGHNTDSKYYFDKQELRPLKDSLRLEYILLEVQTEEFLGITPSGIVKTKDIKRKCIHKGKCPHKGYDLSQVPVVDGVITCPLHALRFKETGELIEEKS